MTTVARILIIEDDVQVLDMLRRSLEREGHEVVAASDGETAIRRYRENPSDLIITDLILPKKDGIETMVELRRDFPDIKIIAMSGGGRIDPGDHLKVAAYFGATYTIAKPFEPKVLLKAVREILG